VPAITLATTLLYAATHPAWTPAELDDRRWEVEVNFKQ